MSFIICLINDTKEIEKTHFILHLTKELDKYWAGEKLLSVNKRFVRMDDEIDKKKFATNSDFLITLSLQPDVLDN